MSCEGLTRKPTSRRPWRGQAHLCSCPSSSLIENLEGRRFLTGVGYRHDAPSATATPGSAVAMEAEEPTFARLSRRGVLVVRGTPQADRITLTIAEASPQTNFVEYAEAALNEVAV